ncbi:hypothetical protein D3C85_878100 [compost metagenome]
MFVLLQRGLVVLLTQVLHGLGLLLDGDLVVLAQQGHVLGLLGQLGQGGAGRVEGFLETVEGRLGGVDRTLQSVGGFLLRALTSATLGLLVLGFKLGNLLQQGELFLQALGLVLGRETCLAPALQVLVHPLLGINLLQLLLEDGQAFGVGAVEIGELLPNFFQRPTLSYLVLKQVRLVGHEAVALFQ